jgi:hypothetical protein
MAALKPTSRGRLKAFDRVFRALGRDAELVHNGYSDPARIADLQERLRRVRESGDPLGVYTAGEREQLRRNLARLRILERRLVARPQVLALSRAGTAAQKALTAAASPVPSGAKAAALKEFWRENRAKNPLYLLWDKEVEAAPGARITWGELLSRFQADGAFRAGWVERFPGTLPKLRELTRIWAWDDPAVKGGRIYHRGAPGEYWVIRREPEAGIPSRFDALLREDYDSLVKLEFAPMLRFNRLKRFTAENGVVSFELLQVEKGRSMRPLAAFTDTGADKKTFPGAELLRKTKVDELPGLRLAQTGELSLFRGPRTITLHEALELYDAFPELRAAVGEGGFSITGGIAQTASNRTDEVEARAAKLAATLMDQVEFARTKDVDSWFARNKRHLGRTILGGVGAGGSVPLSEPGRTAAARPEPAVSGAKGGCGGFYSRMFSR